MNKDISTVLFTEREIADKVSELGAQIRKEYADEEQYVVVTVLKGSYIFSADLVRQLDTNAVIDFITASSYDGTQSTGVIRILQDIREDITGKRVILVEDIVDTGRTLAALKKDFIERGAKDVKICTCLDKNAARVIDVETDFSCFEIGDQFVVGYGLDYNEKYRGLPYIGILKSDVYNV